MEPTEHTFGELQWICPDFTFLDFLLLAPKLHHAMLPMTTFLGSEKQKASGYHHKYLKNHGINIAMLKKFPSNDEIQWHIGTAFQEAHHLWRDLGYVM